MEDNGDNAPRKNPLKEEEDKLLEKSIIKANREAISRLRTQRIQLLKDCMLPTNSEDENEEFDIDKMDRDWQEETNRTTLILETIYDNLRMRDATDTFKNTSIIKNRDGEPQYRITTIVMTEKLTNQADDNVQIQGTFKIKNKQWQIQHQYGEEGKNVIESVEDKSTIKGKLINEITIRNPNDNKENMTLEQLTEKVKSKKPTIKEMKILKEPRQLRSSKRTNNPEEEKESSKKKKPSHHVSKSRQDGLAGDVKPVPRRTPTPKDGGATEPTPGTSGSNIAVEKYESKGRAMILSPDGKLIPFRALDKVKVHGERKEGGNTADTNKYKYIL